MNVLVLIKQWYAAAAGCAFCAALFCGPSALAGDKPPDNVFTVSAILPASLKRVVILPLAHEESQNDLASGCEMLYPVLQSELIKTRKFEVVVASSKTVLGLTGRSSWTGGEVLPVDFLSSLQRVYGCDAVLFCELSAFHAYPPLTIGWRMKLVDVTTQKIIWAADVVYDASDPVVNKSAKDFEKQQEGTEKPVSLFRRVVTWLDRRSEPVTDQPWQILNSPRYFGQFTVSKILQTMPER